MATQNSKNFVENVLDTQKQMVDTMVENTKKLAHGNALVNDTIEKGSELYNKMVEGQKNIFSHATAATDKVTDGANQMNEFYQNWYNNQINMAKQMWEMNSSFMKNTASQTQTQANDWMNPMNMMSNMTNQMTNFWNNVQNMQNMMNQGTNWLNNMQNMNPFNPETIKGQAENWNIIFNQYYDMLNNSFANMHKNFQAGTTQDAYRNMVNVSEGFTRFYEMWMPLWKSIQEKTFNMEQYKNMTNPAMYKEIMDKFFGFMPESSRNHMQNMQHMMQDGMKNMMGMNMQQMQQMRQMMGSMPGMNASEGFNNMLSGYNNWVNSMNNAAAPFVKMMTPTTQSKFAAEWSDIANRITVYNIKNAELQYMIYMQGTKVMDKLAENITAKIEKGEEINSMMALYQEWLNISDKVFVNLFESEEYSKLMAEVTSMQLKLRKDIEAQMEKMMVGIPVATRSEMDEMYKTIYDLKKQVRQLEKMMEIDGDEIIEEEKPATRRTTKK